MKDFLYRYKAIFITVGVLAVLSLAGILACFGLSKAQEKSCETKAKALESFPIEIGEFSKKTADNAIAEAEEKARIEAERKAAEEAKRKAEEEAARKAKEEAEKKAAEEKAAKEAAEKAAEEERLRKEAEEKAEAERKAEEASWVDESAPVFLYWRGTPTLKVGDTFDVHKYIGYADDMDRDVDLNVQGSVDTATEGTYALKITITDDTGKSTSKDMEVRIIADSGGGGGGGGEPANKEQFTDFRNNYKTDETYVGIDVSRWQTDIDFEKIKAAGCEFLYIRLGGYDSGEFFTDKYWDQNIKGVNSAGLMKGIYWYGEESSLEEVQASVKYLMKVLDGEKLDFPIAYDWEDYRNFETHHMNLHDLNQRYDDFEKEIEKYGYTACLYGSKNAQNTIWTKKKKNPVWLAHYNSYTTYEGDYFMWQHSNTGRIDGINGDVDLDVFYPARLNNQ